MPRMSWPGWNGPAYQSSSYIADSEILRNFYLERNESPGAPTAYVMLPCPGFSTFATVAQAPIRGMFQQLGRAFFVAGFAFYELFADGTTTLRGSVEADTHPVTIHANGDAGNQLWITSGGIGYNYDLGSNTLTAPTITGVATMGSFLDARFLYLDANTGAFYASALYDGTTWDPTFVAQSEAGDPWKTLAVTPDDLIHLIGETTKETWANQGASPFPFSKVQEGSSPFGIAAPYAFSIDSTLTWLAQNARGRGVVLKLNGYSPERISEHAIEDAIHSYGDISDATMWGYLETGHAFSLLTFPSAPTDGKTWVVDSDNSLWHERDYWDTATGVSKAYRPGCMMEAFGQTLVGDRQTGTIYAMSSDYQSDVDGAAIRRQRQPPRLDTGQKRVIIDSLQLVMDVGQGVLTGQGIDPQVMLQCSKDGGQTFAPEMRVSAGAQGQWGTRVIFRRCGQARNFVPRFTVSDPIAWRVTDCLVDYRVGIN